MSDPFESAAREMGWKPEMGGIISTQEETQDVEDPFVAAAKEMGWKSDTEPKLSDTDKPAYIPIRPAEIVDQTQETFPKGTGVFVASKLGRSAAAGMYGTLADITSGPAILGVPGAEAVYNYFDFAQEWMRPKTKSKAMSYVDQAVESTTQSLGEAYLVGRLLGGKGKKSVAARGIAGKGLFYGTREYLSFMNDVKSYARNNGLTNEQVSYLTEELRPYAGISGFAEMGGEISSDLIMAKVFGLIGGNKVGEPAKKVMKDYLVKKLAISGVADLSGENATTIAQFFAEREANRKIKEKYEQLKANGYRGNWSQNIRSDADLLSRVTDTSAVTIIQNILTGGVLHAGTKVGKRVEAAKKLAAQLQEKKEAERKATGASKQVGPKTRHKGKIEAVDTERLKAAVGVAEEEIRLDEIKESLPDEEAKQIEEVQNASDVQAVTEVIIGEEEGEESSAEVSGEDIQLSKEEGIQRDEGETTPSVIDEDTAAPLTEDIEEKQDLTVPSQRKHARISMKEAAIESAVLAARNGSPMQSMLMSGQFNDEEITLLNDIINEYGHVGITSSDMDDVIDKFNNKQSELKISSPLETETAEETGTLVPKAEISKVVEGITQIGKTDLEKAIEEALSGTETETDAIATTNAKLEAELSGKKKKQKTVKESEEKPVSKRQKVVKERKEKKQAEKKAKLTVKPITKLTPEEFEEKVETLYGTHTEAAIALNSLGEQSDNYVIRGNKNIGYMLVEKSVLSDNSFAEGIESDTLFQTMEEVEQVERDNSTLLKAAATMQADINRFYHTSIGDIVSIGKQLATMLDNIESDTRVYLKAFNGDVTAYNAWVDMLNRMAHYITQIQKVRGAGKTLDFMGFQTTYNHLVELYNRWKAKRAFHDMKEISARVDGDKVIDIENRIPHDVSFMATIFSSSSLPLSKYMPESARSIVYRIIESELWFKCNAEKESQYIDQMRGKLTDAQAKAVTEMGFHIERFSRVVRAKLQRSEMKASEIDRQVKLQIEDYLEKQDPVIVEAYREVRQAFEAWKTRYKEHLMDEERAALPNDYVNAIDGFARGKDISSVMKINGITTAKEKRDFIKRLSSYYKNLNDIESWGDDDYMTHMMIGDIRVTETVEIIDDNGKKKTKTEVIAVGKNLRDAIEKAKEYAKEQFANNRSVGKITLDDKFIYDGDTATMLSKRQYRAFRAKLNNAMKSAMKDIENGTDITRKILDATGGVVGVRPAKIWAPPTIKSKHILPGEADIYEAMRAYSRVMWKKVSYDPVISEIKRTEGTWESNVKKHVNKTLERSKGTYSEIDKFFDEMLRGLNIETSRSFTRGVVNPIIKLVVNAKLGYRPMAAFLNAVDGYSRVSMQFRQRYVVKGMQWARTPEGKAIIEKNGWALGQRFEDIGGHLKSSQKIFGHELTGATKLLLPTGIFNAPELPIRSHNFATAFVFYKEQRMAELRAANKLISEKMIEEEAIDFAERSARISVWRLQGSNTMAERSRILGSIPGRMFGVFMPFFVRNVEFIAANAHSMGFWAKWVPYTLMMSGSRGFVAMAKSIPFVELIFALCGKAYFWDKLDKWLIENVKGSGGIASLMGIDIVGPATAQFPSNSSTLGTMMDIYKGILHPLFTGDPNKRYATEEGVKKVFLCVKNFGDVWDSYIDKDGWVLEGSYRKYNMHSNWDRFITASGAIPLGKKHMMLTNSLLRREEQKQQEQIAGITRQFRNTLHELNRRRVDPEEVMDSALDIAENAALEYHVKPEQLYASLRGMHLSPGMRLIMNSRIENRVKVLEEQMKLEERYPGTVF